MIITLQGGLTKSMDIKKDQTRCVCQSVMYDDQGMTTDGYYDTYQNVDTVYGNFLL